MNIDATTDTEKNVSVEIIKFISIEICFDFICNLNIDVMVVTIYFTFHISQRGEVVVELHLCEVCVYIYEINHS